MTLKTLLLPVLTAFVAAGMVAPALADHAGDPTNAENGKTVYEESCVFCHGAKGKGEIPGVPDLTRKKGPLAKNDSELFRNIAEGFESPGSAMAMPARGGNPGLSDAEVHDVLAYLRQEFSKK